MGQELCLSANERIRIVLDKLSEAGAETGVGDEVDHELRGAKRKEQNRKKEKGGPQCQCRSNTDQTQKRKV